jgi:hypothetical protein
LGLVEEVILVDETALNEIIIPTMNVDRRLPDGTRDDNEVTNKSQIYVNFLVKTLQIYVFNFNR